MSKSDKFGTQLLLSLPAMSASEWTRNAIDRLYLLLQLQTQQQQLNTLEPSVAI